MAMHEAAQETSVDDPVRRLLRQRLQALYGDRLAFAVLYGSRARGDQRPDSDYVVAVFLKDYDGDWAERRRFWDLLNDVEWDTGAAVSGVLRDVSDWGRRSVLLGEIRRDGVAI